MKTTPTTERCPAVSLLQRIFGGKWKIEILYYIAFEDVHRFGELRRRIGHIAESSLTKQLRGLENLGILSRHDYQEMPLKVEYDLTELGRSFLPIMGDMKKWAEVHGEECNSPY